MNSQVGKSAGIALLMAVGLLALLFAFGVFTPQATPGVSAHECQFPGDDHTDNSDPGDTCNQPGEAAGDHAAGDHVVPAFSMETYTVSIDENKPGSGTDINPVTLGSVSATHPKGDSFQYFVNNPSFRIYAGGGLAYIGAAPGLDYEAAGLESDDDGKYMEIMVAAVEGASPTAPADYASLTDDERETTGVAKVKVYINDIEADPPADVMGDPIMGDPDGMTIKWSGRDTPATPDIYQVQYREEGSGDDWTTSTVTITTQPLDVDDDPATPDATRAPTAGDDKFQVIISAGLEEKTDYEIRVRYTPSIADVQPPSDAGADDGWSTGMGETVSVPAAVKIAVTSEGLDSGELMVRWTNADGTPHDGGGDSEATYKVEYGERRSFDPNQDHTLQSLEATGSSASIQGLNNGTLYHVRVRPMNRVGMGDYSDVVSGTPYGEPSAPRNLQVIGVNHNTLLAIWYAPADMGGYDRVSYDIKYWAAAEGEDTAKTEEDVANTSYIISGLEADTSYLVRVKATNPRGDSHGSVISFGRTTMGPAGAVVPGVVRNLSVSPVSQTLLSASWNSPASDGGAVITGYSVQYRQVGTTTWTTVDRTGTDLNQSISGLTAGTSYAVRVAAMNSEGTGRYEQVTSRTLGTPPPTVPGVVQNLSVSPVSQTRLNVSWNAPTSDGGAAITGYSVQYRQAGATTWMTVDRTGTDLSQSISGLSAETSYVVQVAAINSEGTGSYEQATAQTLAAPVQPADPCLEKLDGDISVSGQWASGCDSIDRGGRHARFYTFTLTQESEVTITLESADADAYLYLRAGETKSGTPINDHAADDDAGEGTNSEIRENLTGGTYTVEATTYHASETGSFTLTSSGLGTTTPPSSDPCLENLAADGSFGGQWASGCDSIDREGRHARFYTFTLTQESEVTITLESPDADAYLYLREGETKSGTPINDHAADDDAGEGTNSQIRENLASGTYTIEATTYYAAETGSFTVTLSGSESTSPPADSCLENLASDMSVSGHWAIGCESVEREGSHARFYSFTLAQESEVTITLESPDADAYLYLREGEGKSGTAVNDHAKDDDAGEGTNSEIRESLAAGTYTIEATTYEAGETGSFTLTVTGL